MPNPPGAWKLLFGYLHYLYNSFGAIGQLFGELALSRVK